MPVHKAPAKEGKQTPIVKKEAVEAIIDAQSNPLIPEVPIEPAGSPEVGEAMTQAGEAYESQVQDSLLTLKEITKSQEELLKEEAKVDSPVSGDEKIAEPPVVEEASVEAKAPESPIEEEPVEEEPVAKEEYITVEEPTEVAEPVLEQVNEPEVIPEPVKDIPTTTLEPPTPVSAISAPKEEPEPEAEPANTVFTAPSAFTVPSSFSVPVAEAKDEPEKIEEPKVPTPEPESVEDKIVETVKEKKPEVAKEEDPEDVKAREEIARLNAEFLKAAAAEAEAGDREQESY